jgi:hypothetical protein
LAALSFAAAAALGVGACSGSDGTDEVDDQVPPTTEPAIGGINGPAVVDPSFDPFATDPSSPPVTSGG